VNSFSGFTFPQRLQEGNGKGAENGFGTNQGETKWSCNLHQSCRHTGLGWKTGAGWGSYIRLIRAIRGQKKTFADLKYKNTLPGTL